jgi:hypothetical protein
MNRRQLEPRAAAYYADFSTSPRKHYVQPSIQRFPGAYKNSEYIASRV